MGGDRRGEEGKEEPPRHMGSSRGDPGSSATSCAHQAFLKPSRVSPHSPSWHMGAPWPPIALHSPPSPPEPQAVVQLPGISRAAGAPVPENKFRYLNSSLQSAIKYS